MGSRQKQLSESERCIREYLCIFPPHCVFSFRSTKHKNCFCIFVWRNRTRFLPFVFFVSIPFKASFFHCSSMTCNGWDQFRWREKEIFDEEKYLKIHIFSVFHDDCSVRPPFQALHTTWNLVFLFYLISQLYVPIFSFHCSELVFEDRSQILKFYLAMYQTLVSKLVDKQRWEEVRTMSKTSKLILHNYTRLIKYSVGIV